MDVTDNESLVVCKKVGKVGSMVLNRPAALNALNKELLLAILDAIEAFDADPEVTVMTLAGNRKAFAAGADIRSMAQESAESIRNAGFIELFGKIGRQKKPLIACVSGFALGGGFELALACDLVLASENAVFGLPEITLGVIPGGGGTQRLTMAVGKALAFEMILDGRRLTASEALALGVVSRVFPDATFEQDCIALATRISERAPVAILAAKRAIDAALSLPLDQGLVIERDLFYSLFNTQDQKEGMAAFLEKRPPTWQGK